METHRALNRRIIYDEAAICESGHVLSCRLSSQSQIVPPFCASCAAAILIQCKSCNAKIQGSRCLEETGQRLANFMEGTYRSYTTRNYQDELFTAPAYCPSCGKPYPWTESTIKEFDEIIDMTDELNDDERAILKESFPTLLVDQPGNSVASMRIAKILISAKEPTIQALKSAIASKLAGKALDLLPQLLRW